jgi:hypothetical protein
MEKLRTLKALLEMTSEAEGLASSNALPTERLKSLIGDISRRAQEEHEALKRDQRQRDSDQRNFYCPTRYQLCIIGIRHEFNFSGASLSDMVGLEARLSRIHEDIARTIKEIKSKVTII